MKLNPAEYVILSFGGVRATARAIGYVPESISKWRYQGRGRVPTSVQELILDIANERNLDITAMDLIKGRNVDYD
jgi:hypothetical protein